MNMKYLIIMVFACTTLKSFAQKQTFDVISYTIPVKWQKTQNEAGVQLTITDKKSGSYAIAVITKATASDATANENFTTDWTRLIKSTVQVNAAPTMQDPSAKNGWNIVSGNADYTDGAKKGVATLLTATGDGKMVSVVLMTNTEQYQADLLAFLNSLELVQVTANSGDNKNTVNNADATSVVGLWTDYILETTGYSINGMPQYTAGYLRKEYTFYPDGTYLFRNKQWLTKTANIVFIYETGTYSVNGNQLSITPKNGKSGFWGKKSSTKEWGKFIKYSDYALEKTNYTFEVTHDPTYGDKIILKPGKPTIRDGGKFNAPGDPYEFYYSKRELESSIDNPPGFKTGFENKSITVTVSSQTNTTPATISNNSLPAEKIWESSSPDRADAGNMQYITGALFTNQYIFYADGIDRFVNLNASAFTNSNH
jgi:hypothetical protein